MDHLRIRKFNTKDTYPEQNLDNDLCQAVVTEGGKTIWLRGQCPQNLDDAVNLVLFAFENGNQGDLFVNKAPASTINDLAIALKELANCDSNIKIIGTRHGEKLYETLCTREEMVKAEDMGGFYRVPADNRDLNYSKYLSQGEKSVSQIEDYHSHNTVRLDVEGVKKLLIKLPVVKNEILKK